MPEKNINCGCCGKFVEDVFATQKYCIKCSLHATKYQKQIRQLKERIKSMGGFVYEDGD